jgi:hypothetical protein
MCAILLLFFLILISKTIEGMEIKEVSNIAQVYMDSDLTNIDKIELLKDKIKDNSISNQDIISIMESSDFADDVKLQKIYNISIDTLFNKRMESPSIYSTLGPTERLDSTKFKQIISILYNDNIEDPTTKITLIKTLNIKDPYLLKIIDDPTKSDNVKLFGKEIDGEELILSENIEENIKMPPLIKISKQSEKKNKKKKK